jgi:hypothetical protein
MDLLLTRASEPPYSALAPSATIASYAASISSVVRLTAFHEGAWLESGLML